MAKHYLIEQYKLQKNKFIDQTITSPLIVDKCLIFQKNMG